MDWLEIAGTAIGLLYLWLEYRASIWMWAASVAMPAVYLFVYWHAGLYADFGISIYYIVISVYGLVYWLTHRGSPQQPKSERPITRIGKCAAIGCTLAFVAVFLLLGWLLTFTNSTVPWADAFTTSLSIVAMWMLARKYLEQWLVWIVVDVASAALYAYKDLWPTAGLYLLYAVIAVAGYRKWKALSCES